MKKLSLFGLTAVLIPALVRAGCGGGSGPSEPIVSTIAGAAGIQGSADGDGLIQARFYQPCGIAIDAGGNLYVADTRFMDTSQ